MSSVWYHHPSELNRHTPFVRQHEDLVCVENYYPEFVNGEWCARVCVRLYDISTGAPYVLPCPAAQFKELMSFTLDDAANNYAHLVWSSITSMGRASVSWHAMSQDEKNECLRAMNASIKVALDDLFGWYKRALAARESSVKNSCQYLDYQDTTKRTIT